jgi:glycosyltransferase involved in cell wall biosynthesis
VVFGNSGNRDPSLLARFDCVQVLTPVQREQAIAAGIPAGRLHLVPHAIRCDDFVTSTPTDSLRRELGIPTERKLVLTVAPLDDQKRLMYLIDELVAMSTDRVHLLAVGQRTGATPQLERYAQDRLPGRHSFVTLPRSRIGEAYRAADCFVLPSLFEGFGVVVLEAMASSTPVLVHDWPLFAWMVPDPRSRVDMSRHGSVSTALTNMFQNDQILASISRANLENVRQRFDFAALRTEYLQMYREACAGLPHLTTSRRRA